MNRIYAIVYMHLLLLRRSFYRSASIVIDPLFEIVLWGVTSSYIRSVAIEIPYIVLMILSGVIFWMIVNRTQNDISVNLLDELWNKNLINIFVAPTRFWEYISALLIFGVIKLAIVIVVASILAFLLYGFGILTYGFMLVPFVGLLLLSGWWMGFLVSALIVRYGSKIGIIAWTAIYAFIPFSAIYYPVASLPQWAQYVARAVPMSYIFEGARDVLIRGTLDPQKLYVSFILSVVYLVASVILLKRNFDKLLDKGLVKAH